MEKRRLKLLLADASLELAPREIWNHPDIKRTASRYNLKPSEIILDKSLHYKAMSKLPFKWKRGRPDILHVTLLNILDSPLATDRRLELVFHTVEGRIFRVSPATRIPVNYERFKGLMAQLLSTGRVPSEGKPLIYEIKKPLTAVVKKAVILDERGERSTPNEIAEVSLEMGMWLVIGLFPQGDFSPDIRSLSQDRVSIYGGRRLRAWTVASRILCAAEEILGY